MPLSSPGRQTSWTRGVRPARGPGCRSQFTAIAGVPYAVTRLEQQIGPSRAPRLAFTLGGGNDLVCGAISALGQHSLAEDIEELMAQWRRAARIADHPQYRWLGPHKGVVHLALALLTNACFDLWAMSRGVPLWRLLVDLTPEQVVALLDLSYLEDVLSAQEALDILRTRGRGWPERQAHRERISGSIPPSAGFSTATRIFARTRGAPMEAALPR